MNFVGVLGIINYKSITYKVIHVNFVGAAKKQSYPRELCRKIKLLVFNDLQSYPRELCRKIHVNFVGQTYKRL